MNWEFKQDEHVPECVSLRVDDNCIIAYKEADPENPFYQGRQTALIIRKEFRILNGDFRAQYIYALRNGESVLSVYNNNIEHRDLYQEAVFNGC